MSCLLYLTEMHYYCTNFVYVFTGFCFHVIKTHWILHVKYVTALRCMYSLNFVRVRTICLQPICTMGYISGQWFEETCLAHTRSAASRHCTLLVMYVGFLLYIWLNDLFYLFMSTSINGWSNCKAANATFFFYRASNTTNVYFFILFCMYFGEFYLFMRHLVYSCFRFIWFGHLNRNTLNDWNWIGDYVRVLFVLGMIAGFRIDAGVAGRTNDWCGGRTIAAIRSIRDGRCIATAARTTTRAYKHNTGHFKYLWLCISYWGGEEGSIHIIS